MGRIYLSVPHMGGGEIDCVHDAFESNWLSSVGPNLDAFEAGLSRMTGRACLATSSGTAAIHLGLIALGVSAGDDVVVQDLTFVASVNPVMYLGASPILVDSEACSWGMDPDLLQDLLHERARTGRRQPKAVVVVHLFGQCADMSSIMGICRSFGVPVLEDAAEAVGATVSGVPAGTMGDVGVYSFNGNKIITTTGGGALLGHPRDILAARHLSAQARDPGVAYEHSVVGYNYRLSNVLAGIGIGQLSVLSDRVRARREIAAAYRSAFADLPMSQMPSDVYGTGTNWLSVFLLDRSSNVSPDHVIEVLATQDIEARPVWKPMHLQPLYRRAKSYLTGVSDDLFVRGICLPSSSSLTPENQERVIAAVRSCW